MNIVPLRVSQLLLLCLPLMVKVYESMDAFGPTALPKLLDAGVIDVVLRGTQSPNSNVSSVHYRNY